MPLLLINESVTWSIEASLILQFYSHQILHYKFFIAFLTIDVFNQKRGFSQKKSFLPSTSDLDLILLRMEKFISVSFRFVCQLFNRPTENQLTTTQLKTD